MLPSALLPRLRAVVGADGVIDRPEAVPANRLDAAGRRAVIGRMRIQVECRALPATEGPLRFVLGDHTIEVDDLLDRWYGDEADYFRVRGGDGHLYVLKHVRDDDQWELTSFTRHGSRGTSIGTRGPRVLH